MTKLIMPFHSIFMLVWFWLKIDKENYRNDIVNFRSCACQVSSINKVKVYFLIVQINGNDRKINVHYLIDLSF